MTSIVLGGKKAPVESPFVWGTVQSRTVNGDSCQVLVDGSSTTLTAYLPPRIWVEVNHRVLCYSQGQKFYVYEDFTPATPITPTLLSSWQNYNTIHSTTSYEDAGFWRVGQEVNIQGLVGGGQIAPGNVFLLPIGYRPDHIVISGGIDGTNAANTRIDVLPSGYVAVVATASNAFVSMTQIKFRAAAVQQ